ncbi:MAG: autotransporter-associated beta strand repeat-containing protein [Caldimonas sp.]
MPALFSEFHPLIMAGAFTKAFQRTLIAALVAGALGNAQATPILWLGTGGDDLWSDSRNWVGGATPGDGADVEFGPSASFQSIVDYSVRLSSFTFTSNATNATTIDIHIGAGSPATLTLSGAGIVSNTPYYLTALQTFYADASAGPVGGTLLFTNTASVSGNTTTLTASGGTVAGGSGGNIIFQDHSSTAAPSNLTGLIAEGATVAGASGGTVIMRDDAHAQGTAQIAIRGGVGVAAAGGQMTVQDRARVDNNIFVDNGGDGFGGRLDFRNQATIVGGKVTSVGSATTLAGGEAVTRFFDNATFSGVGQNLAGNIAGAAGGRMEFHDHSVFASVGDNVQILNLGSSIGGAGTGRTLFFDDASISGPLVAIYNEADGESPSAFSSGGVTEFHDRSHAGQATISNGGAAPSSALNLGGQTVFLDVSSADSATIENAGGYGAGTTGGSTRFANNSSAGNATLLADSGVSGGFGGVIIFQDSASGGAARIVTDVGGVVDISALTTAGTTVGSIEGGGNVFLGGKRLVIGGNGLSTEFSGVASDGGQSAGTGGSLTKVGVGILTLSGANTYTGATLVSGGTLFVNGSLAGSGVAIGGGAKLGGTGTIGAPLNVGAAGTLAPGGAAAPGTLTVLGSLTFDPAALLDFRLGAPGVVGGPKNDLLTVGGNLTLAGTLNVTDSGGFGLGSYRFIDYGGAFVNNGVAIGAIPGGFSASDLVVQTSIGGQVNLVVGGANVLFWDGAYFAANNVVDGGTGSWNNAGTNWTNSSGSANVVWGSSFAVFTGSAGTVTVTAPVASTGMQFATSGYTLAANASGSIALVGAATIRVDPGASATIDAPLIGSGSLTKVDTGTLWLVGNSTYSGGTTIQDGLIIVSNAAGIGLGTGPVIETASPTSELRFAGNASAGAVSIVNQGAPSTLVSSLVTFYDMATAGTAAINNQGNTGAGGFGGTTLFFGHSNAGQATLTNTGSSFPAPSGALAANGAGMTIFRDGSTAGNATVINTGGLASNSIGGSLVFANLATAGASTITNQGSSFTSGGGLTSFFNGSSATSATIVNQGGVTVGATTQFHDSSDAGSANISNGGAQLSSSSQAITYFFDHTSADNARITNIGGAISNGFGGTTTFNGVDAVTPATAAGASIINLGASVAGAFGGSAHFDAYATAGNSVIVNRGATVAGAPPGAAGFALNYAAGNTNFSTSTGAGNATIRNEAGAVTNAYGGNTNFANSSSAQHSNILNEGASLPATAPGSTRFLDGSTAEAATFTNFGAASLGADGGLTQFFAGASAGNGVFHNLGGAVDGAGNGQTEFFENASAGAATLYGEASSGTGAGGGIVFFNNSTGGTARVVLAGAGLSAGGLDISQLSTSGMGIGSIEGDGAVSLGSRSLTVGLNNASTTFSGLIRDGGFVNATGGQLNVQGSGSFTLSGANTYTGATHIGNGVDAHSGKLIVSNSTGSATGTGPVFVERGGMLSGNGIVAGPVTLRAGGVIAPGDPAELTFGNSLTWDGGGLIQLVLGDNQADSDQITILGNLIHGAAGEFRFNLIDDGFVSGQEYALIRAGGLEGFAASDFVFSGISGTLNFDNGALEFMAAPVPEPETVWLMVGGLLLLAGMRRKYKSARC